MVFLALDTATSAITVAVADMSDPGRSGAVTVLAEHTAEGGRRHGEVLAPAIVAALAEAGVDRRQVSAIGVGTGPGPYTGLRVGLVTARVLGAALGIPVHGVCTLDVLAYGAVRAGLTGQFRVATDARRREVYWAAYDGSARIDGPSVDRPADVAGAGPVIGEGARLYAEHFPGAREPLLPSAADLARHVAAGLPATDPVPLYLRRPDVTPAGPRKSVLSGNPR